jgi:hypothetical protein
MAMGKREKRAGQEDFWITHTQLALSLILRQLMGAGAPQKLNNRAGQGCLDFFAFCCG